MAKRPEGMTAFILVWIGQFVSILASSMSQFGLTIWMYQQTQSATALALMQVFFITPFLIMSPFAGVMVDRYDRKLMMMVSDLTAAVATVGIFILFATGTLQFWHLYIASILYGLGNTFQWPAYSAAISTMISKEQLGRANGLMSLLEAGPAVFAPLMAGALLPFIKLSGILFIDFATFLLAIGALLIVFVPQPMRTEEGRHAEGQGILADAAFGFKYIFARPSLLGLQMTFFFCNLFAGIGFVVMAPMILARTGQNSLIFGSVQTAAAVGGIIGGIAMSAWGGFKRRANGVIFGWILTSLAGPVFLGLGKGLTMWIPAAVGMAIFGPLVNGSNQALWQSKVPPDLQGRVFSARRLIAWFTQPIAPLIGGLLADRILEPSMRLSTSPLAQTFGGLFGVGPGAGMGLLLALTGLGSASVAIIAYFIPTIRNAEDILPDYKPVEESSRQVVPAS
jgi:MFS family permease